MDPITSQDRRAFTWFALVLSGLACLYLALALTPSHYGYALENTLGIEAGTLLFEARAIRSDDFAAFTPLLQTALLGDFATTNQISPYGEALKSFWALPIADWSLVFKPQLWAFWVLPPAYAFSLYFALFTVAFLIGYALLFRQFGIAMPLAILAAICLFASHHVQVWWSTNAPTYALAPWPVVVLLSNLRWWLKTTLATYAGCVWIFALVYPPFIIPSAFVFAVAILAFRRDAITLKNLATAAIAGGVLGAAFLAYYGELISIMSHTVYPGERAPSVGTLEWSKLPAHILPFLNVAGFEPLLANSNACEVSVVATFLALVSIVFARPESWSECWKNNRFPLVILAAGVALMAAWMWLPVPPLLGAPLLWTYVPDGRMIWGFGLLFFIATLFILSRLELELTRARVLRFSGLLAFVWIASKTTAALTSPVVDASVTGLLHASALELVPVVIFLALLPVIARTPTLADRAGVTLTAAAAVSGLATFATFNPLQPAHPIFATHDSPQMTAYRAAADANPNGWLVVPGFHGAIFSGVGIPAINHTLTRPELAFFRPLFPEMSEPDFNDAFNRYAHVVPVPGIDTPFSPQSDVVIVPIEVFEQSLP